MRVASRSARGTIHRYFRGNLADVELVRRQEPLPETAEELCAVARSAGSQETAVHLGEKASETAVKALSANGVLGNARIVHFATHGLLASEYKAEPALFLTPPAQPTEDDDGLLTASEVMQLKLDADWVVLSACNTAAGGGDLNSEALSGLARAFFYTGARAARIALGGGFAGNRQPRHQGLRRAQGPAERQPGRGGAPVHAGPNRQRRPQRPSRQLVAVRGGWGRGTLTIAVAVRTLPLMALPCRSRAAASTAEDGSPSAVVQHLGDRGDDPKLIESSGPPKVGRPCLSPEVGVAHFVAACEFAGRPTRYHPAF
jgi:hypothetical protein